MEEKVLETSVEAPAITENTLPKKITKEDFQLAETTPKAKAMQWVRLILVTILSSFLISFTVYGLIKPNNFTIGGIAGMAVLINHMIPVLEIAFEISLDYFFLLDTP